MKTGMLALSAALLLAGCGGRVALAPKEGNALPPKAETAATAATPEQLMTADGQARPKRSDEQLKRSEERRQDKFELPPQ